MLGQLPLRAEKSLVAKQLDTFDTERLEMLPRVGVAQPFHAFVRNRIAPFLGRMVPGRRVYFKREANGSDSLQGDNGS